MLSRRSIFSLFAAGVAIATGAKVQASPVHEGRLVWVPSSDPTPRPSHYVCTPAQHEAGECLATAETFGGKFPRGMLVSVPVRGPGDGKYSPIVEQISTGYSLVPVDSPEGQAVLKSMAAPNAGMSRW